MRLNLWSKHCGKRVRFRSFSGLYSRIRTEYGIPWHPRRYIFHFILLNLFTLNNLFIYFTKESFKFRLNKWSQCFYLWTSVLLFSIKINKWVLCTSMSLFFKFYNSLYLRKLANNRAISSWALSLLIFIINIIFNLLPRCLYAFCWVDVIICVFLLAV